jgi:hypothetical protein
MKRLISATIWRYCRRHAHLEGDPSIAILDRNTTRAKALPRRKGSELLFCCSSLQQFIILHPVLNKKRPEYMAERVTIRDTLPLRELKSASVFVDAPKFFLAGIIIIRRRIKKK